MSGAEVALGRPAPGSRIARGGVAFFALRTGLLRADAALRLGSIESRRPQLEKADKWSSCAVIVSRVFSG